MSRSLAELRAQKPKSLPTRVLTVCLDQELLAEVQRLTAEKQDLEVVHAAAVAEVTTQSDDALSSTAKRKMAQGLPKPPERLGEIDAALQACWAKMRENEGELLLRARPGGEWLRWKDDHPAREKNDSDERLAFGICNASDLADDLGKYVAAWNGDDLAPEDWGGWLGDMIAPADVADMVRTVVSLHEVRISVPKESTPSSTIESAVTA